MWHRGASYYGKVVCHKRIQFSDGVYEGGYCDGKFNGQGSFITEHEHYTGCFKDGHLISGSLTIKYSNGKSSNYEGRFENGKRNGYGVFIDIDGNVWDGNWVNDSFTGLGKVKRNGDELIGYFRNGKLECANAHIRLANGDEYDGPCSWGRMNGDGKYVYKGIAPAYYNGSFRRGLKHGKGVYTMMDGSCYEGDFYEGTMQGFGVMEYAVTRNPYLSYKGQWERGKFHGNGELVYKESQSISSYHGSFYQGNFDGFGKIVYRDGGFYEGEFKATSDTSMKNGSGTRSWANGTFFTGRWKEDEMVMGILVDPSIYSHYIGSFYCGKKSGYGREISKKASKQMGKTGLAWLESCCGLHLYEGGWKNGFFEGEGNYYAPDGKEYKGQWKLGLPSGVGVAILLSKSEQTDKRKGSLYRPCRYSGEWLDGKRHGHGTIYYLDGSSRSGIFHQGHLTR